MLTRFEHGGCALEVLILTPQETFLFSNQPFQRLHCVDPASHFLPWASEKFTREDMNVKRCLTSHLRGRR